MDDGTDQYNGVMLPAIFLDRDGVLIENRPDYVREWSQVNPFPDAIRALSRVAMKNYKVVIVTNQSAVGRGLITLDAAQTINRLLIDLICQQGGQVDGVYMCPHEPDAGCSCRKPRPGLLMRAAQELSLDLQRSWMIGDAWTDLQAGQAAGLRNVILVKTGRGAEQLLQPRPKILVNHFICENLADAIDTLLAKDRIRPMDFGVSY